MRVVHGLDALPLDPTPSVATVGFFDGVHVGHRSVLATAGERARERGFRTVAITFDRHPREVLSPGSEPRLLTTVQRKAELIAACGIDVLVVFPFGFKAFGTMDNLPEFGAPFGLTSEAVGLLELDGRAVSSTSIREALADG